MTEAERHQVLVEWNATKADYPQDKCIHELFEAQAERTPEAVAVVYEDMQLTYRELNRQANQLARYLRKLGVEPEVLVGIYMERSLEMVVAVLCVLKAGGAYVPLDPSYPKERLAFMLEDAGISVLLTQERLVKGLPKHNARIVRIDSEWEIIARGSEVAPVSTAWPENLAYMIYTSGSTGKPKGVQVLHRAVVNFLNSMRQQPGLTEQDILVAVTTLSFDIAGLELFLPLSVGARVVLVGSQVAADGSRLATVLATSRATVMQATPPTWRLLMEAGWRPRDHFKVLCGGESLPRDLANYLLDKASSVWNMYGPTETTIWSATHCVESGGSVIPVGRPIDNTQIYILDPCLNPVPVGVPGELYIGGLGVARGYRNRPELVAEKFIPNPFSTDPGARLYRTGDRARYLSNGNIEFLGRIDYQVKIRGFRVELGEIEAVLAQHPAIREAVVLARQDEPGDRRLMAYIVPHQEQAPTIHDLRSFLKNKLPEYMVPSAFMLLDRLPLTPNGKVDRRALPPPSRQRPALAQPYVRPRNELERWLAGMWREILKLESVGIHDRFFELGGHSLQAGVFINKIQQELGESVYVVALFDAPSIAEFAAFLRSNYAKALARRFPSEFSPDFEAEGESISKRIRKVDVAMITWMRECVPTLKPTEVEEESPRQCRRAIFVLAPPRSGTTLLRVMLAGHPDLFAASELQLLGFHTLAERKAAFSGRFALWLEGALRAVMEIKGCDPAEAKRIMEEYERRGLTTKQFYRLIQDWIAPRILVDKTPSYALDIEALRKAERDFAGATYIHLVRHPYAVVRSFESYHMDQVLFLCDHDFSPRELGELVWTASHQTILEFLKAIPPERQYQMRFEDLTREPRTVMEGMCHRLGLEFHPDLVEPYKNKERKMTDGLYDASTPMGDRKFLEYEAINPKVAETWRTVSADNFLGDVTWEVADRFGYERPGVPGDSVREKGFAARQAVGRTGRNQMGRQRQIRKTHRDAKSRG